MGITKGGEFGDCVVLNDGACPTIPPLDLIPVRRSAWPFPCVAPCVDRDRLQPQETKQKEGEANGALHRLPHGRSSFFMSSSSCAGIAEASQSQWKSQPINVKVSLAGAESTSEVPANEKNRDLAKCCHLRLCTLGVRTVAL